MLEQSTIIAVIVYFFYFCMLKGNVFQFMRDLFAWVPAFWQKPIFACSVCMTPYYGTAIYWLIWGNSGREWVIVVAAASGINAVFAKMFPYAD